MKPLHQKMEHPTNTNTTTTSNAKRRPPNAKRIFICIFVISFPFLYLSLLHVPPSTLLKDTTFWFLVSNSIIVFIATTDSTIFTSSGGPRTDLYDEYAMHCKSARANLASYRPEQVKYIDRESRRVDVIRPKELNRSSTSNGVAIDTSLNDTKFDRSRSEVAFKNRDAARKKSVRRSVTEKRICRAEESEYWKMSNEELNKKVEEFIRKFNREIRLQA